MTMIDVIQAHENMPDEMKDRLIVIDGYINETPIQFAAMHALTHFFEFYKPIVMPNLTLTEYGNIRAEWWHDATNNMILIFSNDTLEFNLSNDGECNSGFISEDFLKGQYYWDFMWDLLSE